MTDRPIITAMIEVANLAEVLGVTNIKDLPGCWEHQVDNDWWIAMNGHGEAIDCSKGAEVGPWGCYVEFNGWPAGQFSPAGGVIVQGTGANEDSFIAALKAATLNQEQTGRAGE